MTQSCPQASKNKRVSPIRTDPAVFPGLRGSGASLKLQRVQRVEPRSQGTEVSSKTLRIAPLCVQKAEPGQ